MHNPPIGWQVFIPCANVDVKNISCANSNTQGAGWIPLMSFTLEKMKHFCHPEKYENISN